MANKKYVSDDVYNAAYRIVNEKHGYETGKAQGSSDYNKHHDNALADYEFLEQNDAELAHALKTNNYQKSMEILSNYAKKSDNTESTPAQVYSATSNTFLDRGNTVSKNIDTMYFDENYGKEIRDNFNAYGKTEGNQAAAGAAADNGGNFGSFADYNKKNTELAYKVAGENAVQAKRSGYAADQSKFFDSWGGAVNTSNLNFGNYENTGKKIEADERMNQDDNETKLAGYESNERIADKELEGIKDTNDTNERMNQDDNVTALKKAELGDTGGEGGGDTPKLTLSQALSAVNSGVVTQQVLDVINEGYGTNYTLSDRIWIDESGKLNTGKVMVEDSDVIKWVEKFNSDFAEEYPTLDYRPFKLSDDGRYILQPESLESVVIAVFGSDEFDDLQKEYLLYDKFGISPETIENMLNDPHYPDV